MSVLNGVVMACKHEIKKGTRFRITDAPGSKIKYDDRGTAQEEPNSAGLFWAIIDGKGRFHMRISEVEAL